MSDDPIDRMSREFNDWSYGALQPAAILVSDAVYDALWRHEEAQAERIGRLMNLPLLFRGKPLACADGVEEFIVVPDPATLKKAHDAMKAARGTLNQPVEARQRR